MAESDSLNRVCTACAWMYEYCARQGMEDAKQGIVQSMAKQFNLSDSLMLEHMDPFQTVKRLIEAGKYNEAIEAFELSLDHVEGMDTSATGLHGTVKNLLKVQAVLKPLRASPPQIPAFKAADKLLFPAGPPGRRVAGSVRQDLEAQRTQTRAKLQKVATSPTPANISALLNMFPVDAFLKTADDYFKDAMSRYQAPTFLEEIMNAIESGKYVPPQKATGKVSAPVPKARPSGIDFKDQKAAQEAAKEDTASEPVAKRRGRSAHDEEPSSSPPANEKSKKAESEEPQAEGGHSSSAQSPASAKKKGKAAQKTAVEETPADPSSSLAGKKRKGVMASAWEIRESLEVVGGVDNTEDWTEIHQGDDPDVAEFRKKLESGDKGDSKKGGRQKLQATRVPASKRRGAKTAEEEEEEEEDSEDEDLRETPVVQKKMKRGGKENAAPVDNDTDESAVARKSPSNEVVRNLRDKSSNLIKQGNDPLQESMRLASSVGAGGSGSGGGSKPKSLLERAGEGKAVNVFSDDEDEDDATSRKLPKMQNDGFQPKNRLSVDKPAPKAAKASKGGSAWAPNGKTERERTRWSEDEEKELMAGVKAYGEGNWKGIWESYRFNNRTPVDIKDKWRNLKKAGKA